MPSGHVALVSDEDAHLADLNWHLDAGYVVHREGNGQRQFMHHMVLGRRPQRGVRVDHVDTNPLNNQRENLRVTTPSQNAQNRPRVTRRGTHRGVSWNASHQKWWARATLNYQTYSVGYFDNPEEAAEAVSQWRAEHMTHSDADRMVGA